MKDNQLHNNEELDLIYKEAKEADKRLFAEMRSNVLLVSGEHYTKNRSNFYKRIRDSKQLTDQQKLRLTKNHIQKIVRGYANNITALAPGISFAPANPSEVQDQKSAELHTDVWRWAKEKNNLDEKIDDWCDDFITLGEVATKIFFDPTEGPILRSEPVLNEDGEPKVDSEGNVELKTIREGQFVFEPILAFNLLRSPDAKDLKTSTYLIIQKMVNTKDLQARFPDHEKVINDSIDETMVVFDDAQGGFNKVKDQVLLKEFYFRPCAKYPKGYFYFSTEEGILASGEFQTPEGESEPLFPIVVQTFDKNQTAPRGQSLIKVMRPYQAEINRAASKMAEHQITLGDDKLLIQNGTKISAGIAIPGVRSINYTGIGPTILPGRDGSQYLNSALANIKELYELMGLAEDELLSGDLDPYMMLFKSAAQKKKYRRYVSRFERFLKAVATLFLKTAKIYLDEETLIQAVGRKEIVNISEFKNSTDLSYQIKLEPQSDDIESKLGRQLVLNQVLQYSSGKLDKEDVGKLIRQMPFANLEESFGDFTMDYDLAANDILALDRGELPPINEYDNHLYMVKRLVSRMRQADFQFLDPEIQNNYAMKLQAHEQAEVANMQKLQMAEQGFIPTGGYLVTADFYVPDPKDPSKTKRAKLPYEALAWLIDKLETQGQGLERLEDMNGGAVAQMAELQIQQQPEGELGQVLPMQQ